MKKIIVPSVISAIFMLAACSKGGSGSSGTTDPCAGLSVKFSTNIQPTVNTSCATNASCHATGSVNSGGPLTDYNKIFAKRAEIKFQVESGFMPKTGSITATEKTNIICWVNSGAPNN